jgi:hypothetical protein
MEGDRQVNLLYLPKSSAKMVVVFTVADISASEARRCFVEVRERPP